ncbi:MAG: ROK family protein [Deltaproteobacteria bacterium]|nr:ROK family protein [Deltaproteobacteria bacterium]MCB9488942.1 ROK family protein [Deltaproteobacteria bacterium]
MMENLVAAIDLGGTAIKSALITTKGEMVFHTSTTTGPDLSPETVVRLLDGVLDNLESRRSPDMPPIGAVGLSVPGGITADRKTVTQSPNFPGWNDVPLVEQMAASRPIPVAMENDANAAALGEAWRGAGQGLSSLALYTLGTGVGGGLVLDGKVWHGAFGMAGELGHVTIEPEGPRCGCGNRGCLEALIQRDAIIADARRVLDEGRASRLAALVDTGEELTPALVARAADDGCEASRGIYENVGRILGIAAAGLLNVLNMEMILVGGGIAGAWPLIEPALRREIHNRAFVIPARRVKIAPAMLGNDAGLFGAAKTAFELLTPTTEADGCLKA